MWEESVTEGEILEELMTDDAALWDRSLNGPSQFHREVTLEQVMRVWHLPIKDAARRIPISLKNLKACCRHLGIRRWPYRTVAALARSMCVDDFASLSDERKRKIHRQVAELTMSPSSPFRQQFLRLSANEDNSPPCSTAPTSGTMSSIPTSSAAMVNRASSLPSRRSSLLSTRSFSSGSFSLSSESLGLLSPNLDSSPRMLRPNSLFSVLSALSAETCASDSAHSVSSAASMSNVTLGTALSSPLLTDHEPLAQPSQPLKTTAQPPIELSPETMLAVREALLGLTTYESVAGVAAMSAPAADPSPPADYQALSCLPTIDFSSAVPVTNVITNVTVAAVYAAGNSATGFALEPVPLPPMPANHHPLLQLSGLTPLTPPETDTVRKHEQSVVTEPSAVLPAEDDPSLAALI